MPTLLDLGVYFTPILVLLLVARPLLRPRLSQGELDATSVYRLGDDEDSWYSREAVFEGLAARREQRAELALRLRNNTRFQIVLTSLGCAQLLFRTHGGDTIGGTHLSGPWLMIVVPVGLLYLWLEFGYLLYHNAMTHRAIEHIVFMAWKRDRAGDSSSIPLRHILSPPMPYSDVLVTAFVQSSTYGGIPKHEHESPVRSRLNVYVLFMHACLYAVSTSLLFTMPAALIAEMLGTGLAELTLYLLVSLVPTALIATSHVQFFHGADQRSWTTPAILTLYAAAQWLLWTAVG